MHKLKKIGSVALFWFYMASVQASTTGAQYPWAETLKKILDSLKGPVAYSFAGIAIVTSGLSMAFLDLSGGAKKFIQAALGISIAFGSVTILTEFFNVSGAVIN